MDKKTFMVEIALDITIPDKRKRELEALARLMEVEGVCCVEPVESVKP